VNKTYFLDTNVLLRFLIGDNPHQQTQAKIWFLEAEQGKREIIVHPIIVAESCFVLESFYKKSRLDIAAAMEVFLSQRWLRIPERDVLLSLWDFYQSGLHFVDSFLLANAKVADEKLLSFDKKTLKN